MEKRYQFIFAEEVTLYNVLYDFYTCKGRSTMNVQQLRCICEVARQDLNVSKAAETLNTSQPGVSTQIRQLEEELGFAIFVRQRSRLVAISSDGALVIERAQRALMEIDDIRQRAGASHR